MSNMLHCRFHNTFLDLRDCWNAIQDGEKLSPEEFRYLTKLLETCQDIVDFFEDNKPTSDEWVEN